MLMIARRLRERLTMPDGTVVWIEVAELQHGKCRLGITAPLTVQVAREELVPLEERCPR